METQKAKHLNSYARVGLYWLVNFLSQRGIGVRRGQVLITGSYAGVLTLPMNQIINLSYGDLGDFSMQFAAGKATNNLVR